MQLIKTVLATTLIFSAATTFAASSHEKSHTTKPVEEKVIVSTQEQPETQEQPAIDTSASEAAPTSTPATTN
ncbi:MAG: hypothetical protein I8H98_04200 [Moraxellaceae bacterium]|nr:hypothetical protein [Moraxellaceae bacterium]MBH2029231.1 hypothetical protein [Moraxellaceae bacterium]